MKSLNQSMNKNQIFIQINTDLDKQCSLKETQQIKKSILVYLDQLQNSANIDISMELEKFIKARR